jgi:hypothetical protein
VDLVANSISLVDDSGKPTNIRDFFVNKDEVIKAVQVDGSWQYPPETINDENVSGLKSMINYIKSNTSKAKPGYSYEDNSTTIQKKKINASKKHYNFDESLTLNKVNRTINQTKKQFVFDDNSSIVIKKSINKSRKQLFLDDTFLYTRVDNSTKNNTYKHYNMVNLNDSCSMIKQNTINNITTKIIPCYINQENTFYYSKSVTGGTIDGVDYYSKGQVDNLITYLQNSINNLTEQIYALQTNPIQ